MIAPLPRFTRTKLGASGEARTLDLRVMNAALFNRLSYAGELAGEAGFEPASSVLETDSLAAELTPLYVNQQKPPA
jgi:hypothetical protein